MKEACINEILKMTKSFEVFNPKNKNSPYLNISEMSSPTVMTQKNSTLPFRLVPGENYHDFRFIGLPPTLCADEEKGQKKFVWDYCKHAIEPTDVIKFWRPERPDECVLSVATDDPKQTIESIKANRLAEKSCGIRCHHFSGAMSIRKDRSY